MAKQKKLGPLGLLVAGVVFVGAGIYSLSLTQLAWIIVAIGVVFLLVGVIALYKEVK